MKKKTTRAERIKNASSARRKAQKEDLRLAILEAAVELFKEQGYESFSLRQVAEEVGYSPTTIYLHFKNKDDLLFQTAMEGFRTFGDRLKAAYDSSKNPYVSFMNIGRAYIKFGLEHPIHYRLMFMQRGEFLSHKPPEGYASIIDSFGILQQSIMDCMNAGILETDDVAIYANTAWAFVHGMVSLNICIPYVEDAQFSKMQELFEQTMKAGFFVKQ